MAMETTAPTITQTSIVSLTTRKRNVNLVFMERSPAQPSPTNLKKKIIIINKNNKGIFNK
jgi:hypothetical protein